MTLINLAAVLLVSSLISQAFAVISDTSLDGSNLEKSEFKVQRKRVLPLEKSPKHTKSPKQSKHPKYQKGFTGGMVKEIEGLWVGDEKFKDGTTIYNYCSTALFNSSNEKNFLTWYAAYLDDKEMSCKDIGIDALNGSVNGVWFPYLDPNEAYILQIEQKTCLKTKHCDYDVLSGGSFDGFEVVAKACGAHLKRDQINKQQYSCELYQTNLLKNTKDDTYKVVVVLTYSSYKNGYDNYVCPKKPTFSNKDLLNDEVAEGIAQFVLQGNFDYEWNDPSVWECA